MAKSSVKGPKRYASSELRLKILIRDNYKCRYCGGQLTNHTANIDHVVPWHKGGPTKETNMVACCPDCNTLKGGKMVMVPSGSAGTEHLTKHLTKHFPSPYKPPASWETRIAGVPESIRDVVGTTCKHRKSPNCLRLTCLNTRTITESGEK